MKVGRNDLCPCGSGKKYKKCCLEKDEQERSANMKLMQNQNHFEPEVDEWEPEEKNEFFDEDWDSHEEMFEEDESDDYSDEDFDDESSHPDDDPQEEYESDDDESSDEDELDDEDSIPELSKEENSLINDWWNEYKMMKGTVTERKHLVAFIEKYPHLVDYMGLEHEVLFEMGAAHFREGIYETFVELLLRIRKEYPVTYGKCYGWHDYDMICWSVAQGRPEDIPPYFYYFQQDNTRDYYGKLVDIISFLRATNHSDILLEECKKGRCIKYSKHLIACDVMSRYLDKPVSQESVNSLMDEIILNGIELNYPNENEYWRERWLRYIRPFTQWDDNLPAKRTDAMKYYLDIANNFAYFLFQKTGLSFSSAEYYSDTVYQYYQKVVSDYKRPVDIFCLDKDTFGKKSFLNTFRGLQSDIDYLAQINALYHYATYLKTCGNITEEKEQEFQKQMVEFHRNYYSRFYDTGPEMLSFSNFPLFEIEN